MAKKKTTADQTKTSVEAGIEALLANARKTSGEHVCLASDLAERVWGLPCDHLSYRWLCDNTCYQMSRIIGIAGMKESCKSAFAMSLAKIWLDAGGLCSYVDTENKMSPALYKAVVGMENATKTAAYTAFSTEQWQEQILGDLRILPSMPQTEGLPVVFIIDSLGGVDTKETDARIEKEGGINPRNTGGMIKCK